jgi:hypothetical protein
MIALRPLTIRGAVDPTGKPATLAHLQKIYAKARAAYKKANAEKNPMLETAKKRPAVLASRRALARGF